MLGVLPSDVASGQHVRIRACAHESRQFSLRLHMHSPAGRRARLLRTHAMRGECLVSLASAPSIGDGKNIGFNSKKAPNTKHWNYNFKNWVHWSPGSSLRKIGVRLQKLFCASKVPQLTTLFLDSDTRRSKCHRPTTLASRTNTEERK